MEILGMERNFETLPIHFDFVRGVRDHEMVKKIMEYHEKAMNLFIAAKPELRGVEEIKNSVRVLLNPRMRSCGGKARQGNVIEINFRLHKDNPQELEDTYVHELAHIVCQRIYPRERGHGYIWQRVMLQMGQQPTRCHNMDTTKYKAKRKKYIYECGCRDHIELSSVRHGRINNGASYRCRSCGQRLSYVREA